MFAIISGLQYNSQLSLLRIVVYSPQIIENYQLKSGEGLSVLFVVIWLLGDLCNLVGALMAGLQATVIILAIYVSIQIVLEISLLLTCFSVFTLRHHPPPPNLLLSLYTPGSSWAHDAYTWRCLVERER